MPISAETAPPGVVRADGLAACHASRAGAPSNAYFYMDAMRAVCAVAVALSHVWSLLIGDYVPTTNLGVKALYFAAGFGHAGVVLFFVLSGYWISRSVVARCESGTWKWSAYLVDRLSRLLVVVIPVLIIGGLLDYVAADWLESTTLHNLTGSYMLKVPHERALSLPTLLGNLVFLQGLAVPPFGSNGPLWSLAYEFWFYIWFPALWLLVRHRRPTLPLAALVLGAIYLDLALGFLVWCCGALLFFAERAVLRHARLADLAYRQLPIVGGIAFAGALMWQRAIGDRWLDALLALGFAAFLLGLIVRDPPRLRVLAPVARYGADASFSLYATHFPLAAFAATLLVDRVRPQPGLASVTVALTMLVITIAAGWFFARATEARTGDLRQCLYRQLSRVRTAS